MKKVLSLLLAALMLFSLAACSNSNDEKEQQQDDTQNQEQSQSDLAYIQQQGKLIVGITDFAPMDYKDSQGNWIGFDAELAAAFAKFIGVEAVFSEISWDNKILELNAKTIDCVWNGMTLTSEVLNAMECSDAYCKNAQVVVVPAAVADQYRTEDSISGLSFAVEAGSAGEKVISALSYQYTPVDGQTTALMEVAAGTSDACVIDLLMAGAMVGEGTSYPDLTYTVSLNSEEYGVGFRKGSDLAAKLNEFLTAASADGTLQTLAEKYGLQEAVVIK